MRFNRDYILKHIKETKFPIWNLYLIQNYNRVPIMYYNGDDFADSDSQEAKLEKSVKRLNSVLCEMPAGAVLSIDLKTAKNAGGQGVIGPIEFFNRTADESEVSNTSSANFSGFGVLNPPAGWVHESTLNGKLEELRAENERRINEIMFKQREHDFKEQMQREREELKELRKELNEEKKKYDSNVGMAAETLGFAFKRILGEIFPQLPFNGSAPQQQQAQLAGADEPDDDDAEEATPKYIAVEKLAKLIYENPLVTDREVDKFRETLQAEFDKRRAEQQPSAQEGGEK